ncbi:MAG: hypothetical protein HZB25_10195 [Candidatus Eisenbacteria bacterium]|nr:hypothetical protein [Candidatus Eisenbacteria bacterium]
MNRGRFGAGWAAAMAAAFLLSAPAHAIIDNTQRIDANSISCFVTNHNSYAYDLIHGVSGLEWPKGSGKTAVYAAGLWVGAKIGTSETPVIKVGEYSTQWGPGPMVNDTSATDNATFKTYKISRGDTRESNPDYLNWPSSLGAPLDSLGNPAVLGDQTLWSVFNDRSRLSATNRAGTAGIGDSSSLGLEIQQTVFAFSRKGSLNNVIFIKWKLINKGGNQLRDAYVSMWSDPDLGDANDDVVGCDTSLSVGFCYNGSNNDANYGVGPPAVGYDFFQGPLDKTTGNRLPMTSFNHYVNGTDPQNPQQTYNYMQGLTRDGLDLIDPTTGLPTKFDVSGDPVAGTGFLDSDPADRRLMLSSGPFNMAPGDTQEVVGGVVIGRGGSYKSSITVMKLIDLDAQLAFDANFDLASPPPAPIVAVRSLANAIDVFWKPNSVGDYQKKVYRDKNTGETVTKEYYFEGFNVWQGPTPAGPWTKLATFDLGDTVQYIYNEQFNVAANGLQRELLQNGSNTGLRFHYTTTTDGITGTRIVNNKPYYFSVTAYNYEANYAKKYVDEKLNKLQGYITETLENDASNQAVTFVPASDTRIWSVVADHDSGECEARVDVDFFHPDSATGHEYAVRFFIDEESGGLLWRVKDLNTGTVVVDSQSDFVGTLHDDRALSNFEVRVTSPTYPIKSATYSPDGTNPYVDAGNGGPMLGGALDIAANFFGTTLGSSDLVPVELRFDPGHGQKGYCYLRGGTPNYGFLGTGDLPFTAWDVSVTPARQINVAFVQNAVEGDDYSNYSPPRWDPPAAAPLGGRQYLFILKSSYKETPDPVYTNDVLNNGDIDMMFAFWMKPEVAGVGPAQGDVIAIDVFKVPTERDEFRFRYLGPADAPGSVVNNDMTKIRVVPNPYYTHSAYERDQFNRQVKFTHLPNKKVTIRIFNLAGDLVRTLVRDDITQAEMTWDLLNENRLPVASGVYIYHVDAPGVGTTVGRMAVFLEREKINFF